MNFKTLHAYRLLSNSDTHFDVFFFPAANFTNEFFRTSDHADGRKVFRTSSTFPPNGKYFSNDVTTWINSDASVGIPLLNLKLSLVEPEFPLVMILC